MKFNTAIKLAVAILIFTTLACGAASTSSSDEVATIVAGTLQASTPLASPTTLPTTGPLPTSTSVPTPVPTPPNLPVATRINFASGSTQAVAGGSSLPAQTIHYVVRASKDQPMIV